MFVRHALIVDDGFNGDRLRDLLNAITISAHNQDMEIRFNYDEDGDVDIEIRGNDECKIVAFQAALVSWGADPNGLKQRIMNA